MQESQKARHRNQWNWKQTYIKLFKLKVDSVERLQNDESLERLIRKKNRENIIY